VCRTAAPAAAGRSPRAVELADIFRAHGPAYRQTRTLARVQRRAMRAVESCRTAALGGRAEACDHCGVVRVTYNSCRNRHCPKCQTLAKERWLQARGAELLPVEYFHVVFTLPHDLNPLAQGNPRVIYDLLFRAALDTLQVFGRDPKHLGGDLGVTALLHTWGQTLSQHLHLHCVVTGGALTRDGARFIAARPGFLFPVRALSQVFRAKYLDALRHAFDAGGLTFAGQTRPLAEAGVFATFLTTLRRRDWVVYSKPPFAGPRQVLEYLSRYTHRVAISNERLLGLERGVVRFRWKDRAHGNRAKIMDLEADEFIRRFLLHVVPDGFVRIRHAGLLANRTRKTKLERCRSLLGQPPPPTETTSESIEAVMLRLTGIDIRRCPLCHRGRMLVIQILPPPNLLDRRDQPCNTS
jgi:hypothetical protein